MRKSAAQLSNTSEASLSCLLSHPVLPPSTLEHISRVPNAGDFVTLVSRITGILFGVAVSLILAVVVSHSSFTINSQAIFELFFCMLVTMSENSGKPQQFNTHSWLPQDRVLVLFHSSLKISWCCFRSGLVRTLRGTCRSSQKVQPKNP